MKGTAGAAAFNPGSRLCLIDSEGDGRSLDYVKLNAAVLAESIGQGM